MCLMKRDIPFNGLTQWSPVITNNMNQDMNKRFLITLLFVCLLERGNIKKMGSNLFKASVVNIIFDIFILAVRTNKRLFMNR